MRRLKVAPAAALFSGWALALTLVVVSAHDNSATRHAETWYKVAPLQVHPRTGQRPVVAPGQSLPGQFANPGPEVNGEGRRLFERETFGGNGRTCLTCHSRETGTVSPQDAQKRFEKNPDDPLFVHDGSDDGLGDGVTRMLNDATILMRIPLHPDVTLKNAPLERFVTVRRGIPTTINTPALDRMLMLDGRQPNLKAQALGAIQDHAQNTAVVSQIELERIEQFQKTTRFFSSLALQFFANGGPAPGLPLGKTASEKRGRRFFEDLPPDFSVDPPDLRPGLCAGCHSGPLLNQTNEFLPLAVQPGTRFQTVFVSEFNAAGNPVIDFVFRNQLHDTLDGVPDGIIEVSSPDPGRALITGIADDFFPFPPGSFDHLNAFKISPLRGIKDTAPYFHDNSAKTLEEVAAHYTQFFAIVTDPDGPGGVEPLILTPQDEADIVAFMKLL